MTQPPFTAAALRGAVDLSSLARSSRAPRQASSGSVTGAVVEGTDDNFSAVVEASTSVATLVVLWSGRLPQTKDFVDVVTKVAKGYAGRLRVVSIDIDVNPALFRAFQVQSVPVTMGLIGGQPVPLFTGAYPEEELGGVLDQLLQVAEQHGVTGIVDADGEAPTPDDDEPPLPPLHQAAIDAIDAGDLDKAEQAYRSALTLNPDDADARIGLAQVELLQRTSGVDGAAIRAAAAASPADIDAQLACADLDLLGGHVDDAFERLIELVRTTAGDDRERVKTRLLELFSVVGNHDERVRRGRTALMSALF